MRFVCRVQVTSSIRVGSRDTPEREREGRRATEALGTGVALVGSSSWSSCVCPRDPGSLPDQHLQDPSAASSEVSVERDTRARSIAREHAREPEMPLWQTYWHSALTTCSCIEREGHVGFVYVRSWVTQRAPDPRYLASRALPDAWRHSKAVAPMKTKSDRYKKRNAW